MVNELNSIELKSKVVLNSSSNMETRHASLFQEKLIVPHYEVNEPLSRLTSIWNKLFNIKTVLREFCLSMDKAHFYSETLPAITSDVEFKLYTKNI